MTLIPRITHRITKVVRLTRSLLLALVTPLMEKNPAKSASIRGRLPFVFSMSRLIVLAFAAAMLHQAWRAGIVGWPEATLSVAIVLALPILGALERARPADAIALARALVGRFGTGDIRQMGSIFPAEPSKFDDHRDDEEPGYPSTRSTTKSRRSA